MKPFLVHMFLVGVPVVLVIVYILYDIHKQNKKYEQENFTEFGMVNKYDAYQKCVKIINSCKTYKQWLRAMEMSHLHYQLYNDEFLEGALNTEWNNSEPDNMFEIEEKDYE